MPLTQQRTSAQWQQLEAEVKQRSAARKTRERRRVGLAAAKRKKSMYQLNEHFVKLQLTEFRRNLHRRMIAAGIKPQPRTPSKKTLQKMARTREKKAVQAFKDAEAHARRSAHSRQAFAEVNARRAAERAARIASVAVTETITEQSQESVNAA